jgi:hypothetical protein
MVAIVSLSMFIAPWVAVAIGAGVVYGLLGRSWEESRAILVGIAIALPFKPPSIGPWEASHPGGAAGGHLRVTAGIVASGHVRGRVRLAAISADLGASKGRRRTIVNVINAYANSELLTGGAA